MKFADLLDAMRRHNEKLDEQYGEIMAEDEPIADTIDESLEWWVDRIAGQYVEAGAEADKCRALAAKYTERAKSFDRKAEWNKAGLMQLALMAGKTIKTAAATVYMSKAQPSLKVDPDAVPEGFMRIVKEPDKALIKEALKDGMQCNFASLEPGKEFVVVKV